VSLRGGGGGLESIIVQLCTEHGSADTTV
jgi:hypothetical protein